VRYTALGPSLARRFVAPNVITAAQGGSRQEPTGATHRALRPNFEQGFFTGSSPELV
jgi:hypothetical protein